MHVDDLGTGIAVAIGITVVNTLATALLAIDDDDFYYRNVLKRQARRHGAPRRQTGVPGVYFLEIDGLAHAVVQRAIRDGHLPTLASWIRDGSHTLMRWETDWSSQTGACQAGLLHGSNDDMPAFRWWEKDRGKRDRHQPPEGRRRDRAPPLRRARACCTRTAPAARTSSPATPRTRC